MTKLTIEVHTDAMGAETAVREAAQALAEVFAAKIQHDEGEMAVVTAEVDNDGVVETLYVSDIVI